MNNIDWLSIGKEHTGGKEHKFLEIFRNIEMFTLPTEMPFMQGNAISNIIDGFSIKPIAVGWTFYGERVILAITAGYTQGEASLYFLDDGVETITPLCVIKDWDEENEEEEKGAADVAAD